MRHPVVFRFLVGAWTPYKADSLVVVVRPTFSGRDCLSARCARVRKTRKAQCGPSRGHAGQHDFPLRDQRTRSLHVDNNDDAVRLSLIHI